MVQTGDPSGTGKGGDCIWGGSFQDEIRPTLKVPLIFFNGLCSTMQEGLCQWLTRDPTRTDRSFSSRMQNNRI
jgi:hypothetical protein